MLYVNKVLSLRKLSLKLNTWIFLKIQNCVQFVNIVLQILCHVSLEFNILEVLDKIEKAIDKYPLELLEIRNGLSDLQSQLLGDVFRTDNI